MDWIIIATSANEMGRASLMGVHYHEESAFQTVLTLISCQHSSAVQILESLSHHETIVFSI